MKRLWPTVCAVAALAFLWMSVAQPDEPGKAPGPSADPMRGKEPGEVRDDNGLKMKLVWCPPGEFTMEQEDQIKEPATKESRREGDGMKSRARRSKRAPVKITPVKVFLTRGYWLGKYEVTRSEWKQVMATEPWKVKENTKAEDDVPATWITWENVMEFCHKLTERERMAGRLPNGWEYTLPTEGQWEGACRAGTETKFSFGDDESMLGEHAWFADNATTAGEKYAHRVGQKKPNALGLYDMHGNVREWCRDIYAQQLPGGRDPEVTEPSSSQVMRGGSFNDRAEWCQSRIRFRRDAWSRGYELGFRVACLPATQSKPADLERAETRAADPMRGSAPGAVRDDNGLKMKLVWCPPGEFTMGSPKSETNWAYGEDEVEVSLSQGFWLGKYEITRSEWKQVMATEPWKGKFGMKDDDQFPATSVSWDDAVLCCQKLTEQERKASRLPLGWEYTLPTEAQWERACRAETETRFSYGNDESKLGEYAWFAERALRADEQYGRRVGQKKPNPWGLFDMHGNVCEWCRDFYAQRLPGGRDPEVTEKGSGHVIRGGGWRVIAGNCRSASRSRNDPSFRDFDLGFRMALSPSGNR